MSISEKDSTASITASASHSPLAWLLDYQRNIGIEARGIERVSPEDRQDNNTWTQFRKVLGLWFAGCGGLTTMSSFFLPTLSFSLNMKQSFVTGLVALNLGCLVPAYCATMGPVSGCRQMVTARFLFGVWGVKVIALICILGGIGWSVVNCVLGGEVLSAVAHVPLYVGIVVIFLGSFVVGIFGIHWLLRFETVIAVPTNLAILLFYVVVCKHVGSIATANRMVAALDMSSHTQTGLVLSFFTIAYSVTATWGSCASDYYILFPESTSQLHIFLVTFLGIAVPSNFAAVVGTLAGTIAYAYPPWTQAYTERGIGGIIAAAFEPWGRFGQFVVVMMYLSLLSNTIINTYSSALQFQMIDVRMASVPRFVWAALISVVYLVLSLLGKSHLSTILGNVLSMLGYWISLYIVLLLEENFLFRCWLTRPWHPREYALDHSVTTLKLDHSVTTLKLDDDVTTSKLDDDVMPSEPDHDVTPLTSKAALPLYQWRNWDSPKHLTAGWASCSSFLVGVAGAVLGMNQVYFVGPVSRLIGDYGGDVGMWLCMGFCGLVYPVFRTLELKKLRK